MAVITLADTLLNFALFGNTVATADGRTIKAVDDAILNAQEIFKLIPTTVEISDTGRERVFVLGFIAQNQNRFIGGNVAVDKMQMIYGKLDDDYIYITVVALKKACVMRQCQEFCVIRIVDLTPFFQRKIFRVT